MDTRLESYLRFFCAGLLKGEQTGAIIPSQRFLVDKMIAPVPKSYTGQVVELGAGTGALTMRLAVQRPTTRVLACEINPTLAKELRVNLDRSGINGQVQVIPQKAELLLSMMAASPNTRPDFIISGIPLGTLSQSETFALIDLIYEALAPGGMYIQFQYSLIDRSKIRACFSRVRTLPVLLNLPPAFVYYATKRGVNGVRQQGAAAPEFNLSGR